MLKLFKLCSRQYCTNHYKKTTLVSLFQNSASESNTKICVHGWVKALRKMKQNIFLDLSDGTTDQKLQVTLSASQKLDNLTTGSSIEASGCLQTTPKGQLELLTDKISVVGPCVVSEGYPFAPRKTYPPEYIREYPHLRPRTNKFAGLLRVRHHAIKAINDFYDSEGYFCVHTPILTSNDCEGAGEVFNVQPENKGLLKEMAQPGMELDEAYFNTKAFLTVSGQLHLEAVAHGLSKVYTFGPTFRAENSKSRLHLSEFYMVEAEIAFVERIEELCTHLEHFIQKITKNIVDKCPGDVKSVLGSEKSLEESFSWLNKKFMIMSYEEAMTFLEKNKDKCPFFENTNKKDGFTKEQEIALVNLNGGVPIFVINWPKGSKPFYMKTCPNDQTKVAALDLLGPNVGEIIGGSVRENNYDTLKNQIPDKKDLDWYLELRKFGSVPTAGYGMGFERFLQMLLGINNIKDTIPFPRSPHSCKL